MNNRMRSGTMHCKDRVIAWKWQKGMTLMELLVAGFISIIVTSGMVLLMANTLGTSTNTIKMSTLSGEMRAAMQIIMRELRRANYHSTYAFCFGSRSCLADRGITGYVTEINIAGQPSTHLDVYGDVAGDCIWFFYDRPQPSDSVIAITAETIAAFRLDAGSIQMAIGATPTTPPAPDTCPTLDAGEWVNITNPLVVDIESFSVTDARNGFVSYAIENNGTLSIERIAITMSGKLIDLQGALDRMASNDEISKTLTLTIQDFVRVRNDIVRL